MAKVEVKMPKLPKSLGACVDLYYDLRQERLAYSKGVDERKAAENYVSNYIIDNVPKGDAGAVGKRYKGIVQTSDQYQVEDWPAFYAHIAKTGNFQFLNRAVNQAAVQEFVDEQTKPARAKPDWKPKLPPGVKVFKAVKLSVTKL